MTITRSYDSLNRLELIEATGPSGVLARFDYTLDAEGTRTGVSEVGGSRTWTYDPEDRLTSERITDPNLPSNGGQLVYTLDADGNRTQLVSGVTGIFNQANTLNGNDELASEAYDLNGNALSAAGHTYTYSARNELLTVDGGAVKYGYDPQGLRISKESAGTTTWFLWDDLNPTGFPQVLVEYTGATPAAATPSRTYAFGHGRISQREAVSGQTSFFIGDGIGTTRLLTDEGGHEAATFTYDAFGVVLARTGTRTTDNLFAGEHFDADADLVYLRARWLDQATGRFLGRDPVFLNRLGRENAFLYVSHDPVNRMDPSGEVEYTLAGQLSTVAAIGPISAQYVIGLTAIFATELASAGNQFAILHSTDATIIRIANRYNNGALRTPSSTKSVYFVSVPWPPISAAMYTGLTSVAIYFGAGGLVGGDAVGGIRSFADDLGIQLQTLPRELQEPSYTPVYIVSAPSGSLLGASVFNGGVSVRREAYLPFLYRSYVTTGGERVERQNYKIFNPFGAATN